MTQVAAYETPGTAMPRFTFGDWARVVFPACIAFALLLIGTIYSDPSGRLIVGGIPIQIVFVVIAVPLAFLSRGSVLSRVMLITTLLFAAIPSVMLSTNTPYAIYKVLNLIVVYFLSTAIFVDVLLKAGPARLSHIFVGLFITLFVCALAWKLRFGLFSRDVMFFMNGPIVFARLMGIGAVLAWLCVSGKKRYILVGCFLVAMVWTESKGPLVAIFGTVLAGFLLPPFTVKRLGVVAVSLILAALLATTVIVFERTLSEMPILKRYFVTADIHNAQSAGSIGTRLDRLHISWEMFQREPVFGVGMGDWGIESGYGPAAYPHNLFLEIFTEMGLLLGLVFLIPYIFLSDPRNRVSPFFYVLIFMWFASMVSGDLLDSRYILVFGTLAWVDRWMRAGMWHGSGHAAIRR